MKNQQRLSDLLTDDSIFGLAPDERDELDGLLVDAGTDEIALGETLQRTAAEFYLAITPDVNDKLPDHLRSKVLQDAALHRTTRAENSGTYPTGQPALKNTENTSVSSSPIVAAMPAASPGRGSSRLTWLVSVAASLLIGLTLGNQLPDGSPEGAGSVWVEPVAPLTRIVWATTDDPASASDASGEVVWSDASQSGYMTFKGLAANDPSVEQYQLWVFDEARPSEHPVNGGVFDIPADTKGEEVTVRINPELSIDHAVMFAITVERPGGVVVSDRSRLPLLAQVN